MRKYAIQDKSVGFRHLDDGDKSSRYKASTMGERVLRDEEADQLIIQLLHNAGRPLTTREVQEETQKRLVRCPDSTVVFLNKLRIRGVVHGEMSKERRGWIWWI
jgi:hypothetical protein